MQNHLVHLGAKRDLKDTRDHAFTPTVTAVPESADLSHLVTRVYDQRPMLMACSANALASTFEMVAAIERRKIDDPSRLFFYYNARERDGDPGKDDGASIRDAIKAAVEPGTCAETLWPYDETKVLAKPDAQAYAAATEKIAKYARIEHKIDAMKSCIAEGYPFIFGIDIFPIEFTASEKSGTYEPPQNGEASKGGHAMVGVGYDANSFKALNSLGSNWGNGGFLTIPNAYFLNTDWTFDFWTIRSLQ